MSSIDDMVIYIDNTRKDIQFTEIIMEICQGRNYIRFSSVQLLSHGLQHVRLPCPSPTPGAYSNSCPSPRKRHPTISLSVFPFSSSLQFFPASGSFPKSQFFASGGQSIGVSASASVFPMNIQD